MLYNKTVVTGITAFVLAVLLSIPIFAQQNLTQPRASQQASVSQRVGLTDITIDYHRPGVKDREIWGALVPYDQVWRAGANENTTIAFSSEVSINGNKVPAGTYGLHMLPTQTDWTIILSKDYRSWGSFFYDETNDQLRFTVKPETDNHQERLIYTFDEVSEKSAALSMRWEKLRISFNIDVDVNKVVAENMSVELTNLPAFSWQGWNQAANYYLINKMDLNQALTYVDRSLTNTRNVTNLFTKSLILIEMGNNDEALTLKEEAFANANENAINALGYQYLFGGKTDLAMELFKKNVEMFPDSWNVYDSLAECFAATKDNEQALEYYTKALEKAPENQKQRINGAIANLK
jgi:tetratricopeptide (TPR) repeat protein